jgi:hypothetical protein
MGVIERAIAVPRRVALRAHGDILDNVFAARDLRLRRGNGRSRCLVSLSLRTWWLLRIRYQHEEKTRTDEQQYHPVCYEKRRMWIVIRLALSDHLTFKRYITNESRGNRANRVPSQSGDRARHCEQTALERRTRVRRSRSFYA